jgi:hypothetical protein
VLHHQEATAQDSWVGLDGDDARGRDRGVLERTHDRRLVLEPIGREQADAIGRRDPHDEAALLCGEQRRLAGHPVRAGHHDIGDNDLPVEVVGQPTLQRRTRRGGVESVRQCHVGMLRRGTAV